MEVKYVIGERFKKVREYYQETQREFAERIGIRHGLVSKYERAELELPDYVKQLLSNIGISQDWLISGIGDMFLAPQTLGKRLELARQSAGHDQKGLATLLDVSLEQYKKWESDEEEPPREILQRIEKITHREYRWILTGRSLKAESPTGELSKFEQAFPDVCNIWRQWGELNRRINDFHAIEPIYRELDDKSKELVEAYARALYDQQKAK